MFASAVAPLKWATLYWIAGTASTTPGADLTEVSCVGDTTTQAHMLFAKILLPGHFVFPGKVP